MSSFASDHPEQTRHRPAAARRCASSTRLHDHGSSFCLAAAALAAFALIGLAGCQTPPQTAAPVYGSTVAPPATGMIGQPASYGSYPASPQAVAYPAAPGSSPMPGPATSWQSVAQPAAPAGNTWSWAQSGNTTAPAPMQPPASMQQYGNQLANQANQYQQSLSNQAQQYANQLQAQPQQYANQMQQSLANQQQQLTNQLQNSANQYQQSFNQNLNNQAQQLNNQFQQGMQGATNQLQQAMPQMPAGPQQQTANGNWWPFSNTSGMPPARSIPAQPTRY